MGRRKQAGDTGKAESVEPPSDGDWDKLATNRLEAMRHPLRARILRLLVEREVMSPAELSRALHAELSDVSYHVRRLEKLECAELVSTRPVRGALEHFYRAIEHPMVYTDEFEHLDRISADDLVYNTFQKIIEDFVASRKAKMIGFDKYFQLLRTPQIFDQEGLEEGMEIVERCRLELSEVERKSAERRSETGAPGIPASSAFLLFKVPSRSLDT
jgi:DNA-binding transcriptional ArsR family regulator